MIFNPSQVVVISVVSFMVIYNVRCCLMLLHHHLIWVSWMGKIIAVGLATPTASSPWLSLCLTGHHLSLTWRNNYIVSSVVRSSNRTRCLFRSGVISSSIASHQRIRLLCLWWIHIVSRLFLMMLNRGITHLNTTSIWLLSTLSKILIHDFVYWLLVV